MAKKITNSKIRLILEENITEEGFSCEQNSETLYVHQSIFPTWNNFLSLIVSNNVKKKRMSLKGDLNLYDERATL